MLLGNSLIEKAFGQVGTWIGKVRWDTYQTRAAGTSIDGAWESRDEGSVSMLYYSVAELNVTFMFTAIKYKQPLHISAVSTKLCFDSLGLFRNLCSSNFDLIHPQFSLLASI